MAEAEEPARGALRRMGVSLNRLEVEGLWEAPGQEKVGGEKEDGLWLSEVELLRLVLRFSRGVEGRRAEEAVDKEEEGGRGEGEARFSALRFVLVSEPVAPMGDVTPARALSSSAGLLAPHGWLRTDVVVEQSGRDESDD